MVRTLETKDIPQILDIYNYYVLNTEVTFDDKPFSFDTFFNKVQTINKDFPFLVFENDNRILGYAYGSQFRPKPAYNKTVESTVYVKHGEHGKQIGTRLYSELLNLLQKENYHVVIGVLTLPNAISVKLHEKFGFVQVAQLKEVGFKFNKWLDVGFWQLNL